MIENPLLKLGEKVETSSISCKCLDRFPDLFPEFEVGFLTACDSQNPGFRVKESIHGLIEECRKKFSMREVARGPEDDDGEGSRGAVIRWGSGSSLREFWHRESFR
jgi:hypothetical protein